MSRYPGVVDAVVIGAGPNGLVAANALAEAGWDVVVLEAGEKVGGAVRSSELVAEGFTSDLFSAFYPLAAASPIIRELDLQHHGLTWVHAPNVLAHPLADGQCAVLSRTLEQTQNSLDRFAPGDGEAWGELFRLWQRLRDPLLDALFTPFPPVRSAVRLLRRLGSADALDTARLLSLPVRRLAKERFNGTGAALLLTGNALHADVMPDAAGSGAFGWLMCMLAQDVGFPVPQGGAQHLADALADRAVAYGAQIHTLSQVSRVVVADGQAIGVRTADGSSIRARRAVLADVSAPALYHELIGDDRLPPVLRTRLNRFELDWPTLKINWALDRHVAWEAAGARSAGTVHLGVDADGFVDFAAQMSKGQAPENPFVLFGQMTTADPTRSPKGTESAWAYTHLPQEVAKDPAQVSDHVERVERAIEQLAPGFLASVLGQVVQTPMTLQDANANLLSGTINGGTSAIHQQAMFRPVPGTGRPQTPFRRLYLASAAAHPGGGVHGAPGWNAANAALHDNGLLRPLRTALHRTAWHRLLSSRGVP